eukprot:COSAG06_NODE_1073_length_10819_cov_4.311847_9_plen_47_part_00
MRTDVYVRRLHYGLVLCKLAVICLDPSRQIVKCRIAVAWSPCATLA